MNRRNFVTAAVAIAAGRSAASATDAESQSLSRGASPNALQIIRSTLVVDGYRGDLLNSPLKGQAASDEYVRRLKAAGIGCHVGRLDHPGVVTARSVKEIRRLCTEGKIAQVHHTDAMAMGTEHLELFSAAPFPIAKLHAEGLRIIGIARNIANVYGGGCLDANIPLTRAGRRLVEEAHKHRVLIDVGGCNGERTSLDAIAMDPTIPVVNTSGNVRALNDNARCDSDRLIEAIARTGGVMGISAFSDFLARNPSNAHLPTTPQAGLEKYLDQFDYVKRLVGTDHIGIAPTNICDGGAAICTFPGFNPLVMPKEIYSEIWTWAKGFESVEQLPNVVEGLIRRGWSTPDIRKVLGENWLRVYEKAWGA